MLGIIHEIIAGPVQIKRTSKDHKVSRINLRNQLFTIKLVFKGIEVSISISFTFKVTIASDEVCVKPEKLELYLTCK